MQLGSVNKPDVTVTLKNTKKSIETNNEVSKEFAYENGLYHFETAGDVTAEHAGLQRLHMTAHVGLRVHDMAVVCHLVEDLLLLVGEDDVGMEGLHHEQSFTQSPRTLTQHLVSEGNMNRTKSDIRN